MAQFEKISNFGWQMIHFMYEELGWHNLGKYQILVGKIRFMGEMLSVFFSIFTSTFLISSSKLTGHHCSTTLSFRVYRGSYTNGHFI